MNLSGNKNVDHLILDKLDDKSLLNFCISNPKDLYLKKICNDEDFWKNRFIKIFGKQRTFYKSERRTWKDYYLKIIFYLDKHNLYKDIGNEINPDAEETDIFRDLASGGMKNKDLINFFTSYVRYAISMKNKDLLKGAMETGDREWIKYFQRK